MPLKGVTASEPLGLYKWNLASSSTHSWTFWSLIYPCELSQTSPTHSLAWLCIQVSCEWSKVHLLEWLYLVSLGALFCCGFLITLGGCRHLDGLEQWRSFGMLVIVRGHSLWSCEGFLGLFPGRVPKVILMECLWLVYLCRFLRHPCVGFWLVYAN
jgi:hypothetical protein